MIVSRFYEPAIAQTSYLIGCAATGEAIVIDPNRDIGRYLAAAAREGVAITHVTETHIHADFLSGARELAARTGAKLYLSDEGDQDWKYQFASEGTLIRHGDRITVGNVIIEVVATPGHTPEHLTFLVTDGAAANRPIAAATGDFVFVGDVGRPDLLERAANMKGTMEKGARVLWSSLQMFKAHQEDWLQIWPGHGAGSACGKGISAVPYSTVGYERRFNWAFNVKTEDDFVAAVLAGQPEPPKYFATMKHLNKLGPRVLGGFHAPPRLDDHGLPDLLALHAVVVDTRPAGEYAAEHLPGTLNIPLNNSFVTWAGWLLPVLRRPVLHRRGPVRRTHHGTGTAAGVDRARPRGWRVRGEGRGAPGRTRRSCRNRAAGLTVDDMAGHLAAHDAVIVDVRNATEWAGGHLPSAIHIPLGYLSDRLDEVPSDRPVVVHCMGGGRSAIAASLLQRAGRTNVSNMVGGFQAWQGAGLPVVAAAPS